MVHDSCFLIPRFMKITELRQKSHEELKTLLEEKQSRIDELKSLLHQKKVKNVKEMRTAKRDVARILTLLNRTH